MSRAKGPVLAAVVLLALLVATACGGTSASAPASATSTASPATAASTPAATTPTPSTSGAAMTTPDLVQLLRPSVVRILSEAASLDIFGEVVPSSGVGTGIVIDDQGHIVTNNHVVVQPNTCDQPAESITVTLSDGSNHKAKIIGRDVPTDLAVLQIDAANLTPAPLGDSSALQVGDGTVAIGNALDLPGGPTVTQGVVSAKDRLIQEQDCGVTISGAIQTDAAINPGNSGGPLVNMEGQVVGITTAIVGGAEGIGFAISTETAKPVISQLIDKGKVERSFLGVSIVDVTPSLAQSFDLPVDHGVGVRQAQSGGPADKAGLKAGDIIVKIAGQEITASGDLFSVLADHHAGETVKVDYYRDGKLRSTEVTLASQPS